jgi:broad specificity phosphatase PhoE
VAELIVVRHGQASFGAANYDQLSELGWQQSRWLGQLFAQRGWQFDRVITGTLQRHRETLAGIADGMQNATQNLSALPATIELAGLNEYDSSVMLKAKLGSVDEQALGANRREYFKVLRDALYEWVDGSLKPQGYQSFAQFREGVVHSLQKAAAPGAQRVLLVSSGGPISNVVGHVLQTPHRLTVDLNLQTRNASYSQFAFSERGLALMSFNNTPHLEHADRVGAVTYS